MIILGPSSVSSVNDKIVYQLYPAGLDPFDEVDLSNETGVTFSVTIGGSQYLLSPQSTVRYPILMGVTQITLSPLTSPSVTGSVYGIAYTSTDPKPSQVARGSNFLGGAVGLPIDPLVLGSANSIVLGTQASGDTVDRFKLWADGTQQWGPGNAAVDTQLSRTGAGILTLTGGLVITGNQTVQGSLTVQGALAAQSTLAVTGQTTLTGALVAAAVDNFFGTAANGVINGSRIRLSAAADANAYIMAESPNLADVTLHLRSKGAGSIVIETGGGVNILTLTSAGVGTLAGSLNVAGIANSQGLTTGYTQVTAGGLDVNGSPSGYHGEVRFTPTATGGIVALSTILPGAGTQFFDHRGVGNTGSWSWRNGTSAANTRMTLTSGGSLNVSSIVTASGGLLTPNVQDLAATGAYIQTVAADGIQVQGRTTGIRPFRVYEGNGNQTFTIGNAGDLFSLDTPIWIRWVNGSSGFAFSQVRLTTGADIRNALADTQYFLRVI